MSEPNDGPAATPGPAAATGIRRAAALAPRRGAQLLLELLESEGVEYIFGNPGTTELPLIDALLTTTQIAYVLALQEASVVAMADGYAQAARRPGFINLHTAGGLGHGLGNLLNASISGTPLVVTAGQQDSRHALMDPLLFGDLVGIAAPSVKWAREVTHVDQLPILVRRAFLDCSAAPSGPVFLSLPMDMMEAMTDIAVPERSTIDTAAVAGSLDRMADLLASVAPGRLALIAGDEVSARGNAGGGAPGGGATDEMVMLADALGAPVYGSSWPAHLPFPTAHPLWSGNLPTRADEIADVLSNYDALFALGGKSVITILYTEGPAVPDTCRVFQLSTDVRDLGRSYPTELSLQGDIQASLRVLVPMLRERVAPRRDAHDRAAASHAAGMRARRGRLAAQADREASQPVTTPLVAAREVLRAIGPGVPIVDEAIATSGYLRSLLYSESVRQYAFLRGGALGWGLPASVGYSLGIGREPVVCLVGDGAALYSPQALWTAAHEKLPVTFVVMNNREYNILKTYMKGQAHYLSRAANRFIAMDLVDPPIDYLALAASMGVAARRVERAGDIAAAVEAGIASGAANLIEVPISV
ncbi:thiamine pyrophosphate-binding protein [Lichenicoccus sp.]|uniref:thiamine pyrophosphate-binding protein n=1 Tax=Lichenicoccus sp. TaxID=2781899 RepID=UPI003D0DFA8A